MWFTKPHQTSIRFVGAKLKIKLSVGFYNKKFAKCDSFKANSKGNRIEYMRIIKKSFLASDKFPKREPTLCMIILISEFTWLYKHCIFDSWEGFSTTWLILYLDIRCWVDLRHRLGRVDVHPGIFHWWFMFIPTFLPEIRKICQAVNLYVS